MNGINALLVPEEGIIDFRGVMQKLTEHIKSNGGNVILESKIDKVIQKNKDLIFFQNGEEKHFNLLVNCAGLHSDRVYNKITNKKDCQNNTFSENTQFKDNYKV